MEAEFRAYLKNAVGLLERSIQQGEKDLTLAGQSSFQDERQILLQALKAMALEQFDHQNFQEKETILNPLYQRAQQKKKDQ